ncbi:hypothetical protein [Pseudomonas viridiflava]|uniref:hypothetical protein n=1 Tax=Pseudomonas viridiflava TaxID=33069 RepID=UPI000F053A1E|nr:hypothetical protein [Pseudomonas viridiflava]
MNNSTFTPVEAESAPLALLDLEVPGSTGPIPTGELGINRAAAQDNFPQNGLQIFIQPWGAMGPGDSVDVRLGDNVVVSDLIDALEVNQRLTLFIPSERLTTDLMSTLRYTVKRLGQQPENSGELQIYVKLTLPGGKDQDGDTPGHSELHLEIEQEYIDNGVDKDQAAAGIPVLIKAYPNMAEHDLIRLSWGGEFLYHTVLAGEVDADIPMTVEEDTILAAGDSGPDGLAVTFEVFDLVDNRSEDWSAEIRLVVDTDSTRLDAPFVDEADNNVLDLEVLGDEPATVQVVAMKPGFAVGDQIEVKVRGTTANGESVEFVRPLVPVTSLNKIFDIQVPNANIRALAQTQAIFSYRVIKLDNTADRLSKGQFVGIIGEAKRLLAPIARDANQGTLNPDLLRTTIEIPWDDSMAQGQVIELHWLGKRPDLSIYTPALPPHPITHGDAEAKTPIPMVVPGTHLTPINGGTLELYYDLLSDVTVRALVRRQSLHTVIFNVGEPRAELPEPIVEGELDGVLNPEDVPTGTRLIVPKYNGRDDRDEVHIEWVGSITGKYEDYIPLNPIISLPLAFDIHYEYIAGNQGGTVDASYFVVRGGTGRISSSEVLTLQIGEGAVIGPVTGDEGFETQQPGQLAVNTPIDFTSGLVLTVVAATPKTAIIDPAISEFGNRALLCASGHIIEIEFGGEIGTFLLSHARTATTGNRLEFFNKEGNSIKVFNLKVIPSGQQTTYETVVLDSPCVRCELAIDTVDIVIDNLVWIA